MSVDAQVWLAIPLAAMVVYATRAAGPIIMARVTLSPSLVRFLNGLALSVIAAIVASALAQSGPLEFLAVAAAALMMLATRSAIAAMAVGIGFAAAWSQALPS